MQKTLQPLIAGHSGKSIYLDPDLKKESISTLTVLDQFLDLRVTEGTYQFQKISQHPWRKRTVESQLKIHKYDTKWVSWDWPGKNINSNDIEVLKALNSNSGELYDRWILFFAVNELSLSRTDVGMVVTAYLIDNNRENSKKIMWKGHGEINTSVSAGPFSGLPIKEGFEKSALEAVLYHLPKVQR